MSVIGCLSTREGLPRTRRPLPPPFAPAASWSLELFRYARKGMGVGVLRGPGWGGGGREFTPLGNTLYSSSATSCGCFSGDMGVRWISVRAGELGKGRPDD